MFDKDSKMLDEKSKQMKAMLDKMSIASKPEAGAKPKHGGARVGAGKPKIANPAKHRSIRLNDADYATFMKLGGAEWLRRYVRSVQNINQFVGNPSSFLIL